MRSGFTVILLKSSNEHVEGRWSPERRGVLAGTSPGSGSSGVAARRGKPCSSRALSAGPEELSKSDSHLSLKAIKQEKSPQCLAVPTMIAVLRCETLQCPIILLSAPRLGAVMAVR